MVRKVKFLSSQSTFRELNHLLETTTLKTIPLVDSKGKSTHTVGHISHIRQVHIFGNMLFADTTLMAVSENGRNG